MVLRRHSVWKEVERIWEDDLVLAFHHPEARAKTHVVIIPKKHIPSILDPTAADGLLLVSMVTAVSNVAHQLNLDA